MIEKKYECTDCGKLYLPDRIFECAVCEDIFCPSCDGMKKVTKCEECEREVCYLCIVDGVCEYCRDEYLWEN